MKRGLVYAALLSLMALVGVARADEIKFYTPTPADLSDLDHYRAYAWGLEVSVPVGEEITSATLTLANIRNWDNNPNILYIQLLDFASRGVTQYVDNQGAGDFFAAYSSAHLPLVTYQNLTTKALTLTYNFTLDEISVLNSYLADGRMGLGFDPDCHFYNDGVKLQLATSKLIPEPATMGLLLMGAATLWRKRRP